MVVEILGYKNETNVNIDNLINNFNDGLEHYYKYDWDAAIKLFSKSNKFETNNPDIFIGMYKFWVRKIK